MKKPGHCSFQERFLKQEKILHLEVLDVISQIIGKEMTFNLK